MLFRSPSIYPEQSYAKLLELGMLVIYVFDDIHPDQKGCFEMHRRIATNFLAKAKPCTWLFVQNRRSQVSADIAREPLPSEVGTQVLAVDFKQASEVTTLINGIVREGRKQLTLQ